MITLSEYESKKVELNWKDVAFLNKYHDSHLSVKQLNETEVELKANSYVGKIVLPSKNEIIVKPKVKINNLLYMIRRKT